MASTATSSAGQRHIHANNLQTLQSSDRLCAAFGIKITTDITIISIAKTAGYDCLFIDLEVRVIENMNRERTDLLVLVVSGA